MRLGIVGCGAAARLCHLPPLTNDGPFLLTALVDRVIEHAVTAADHYRELRGHLRGPGNPVAVLDSVEAALPDIDAAVVATPHATHADVAERLLRAGKHVLVEKPLALTPAECARIGRAAREGSATVVPAHVRRLFPAARWVLDLLQDGTLGEVTDVTWQEGRSYDWPLLTDFMFAPPEAGGGVLADTGPHVFDMLYRWFGGPVQLIRYADNSAGGAESEVHATVRFGAMTAAIELSRLRELPNVCVLHGTAGSLTVGTGFSTSFVHRDARGRIVGQGPVPVPPRTSDSWEGLFRGQLEEFHRAVEGGTRDYATFEDAVATVNLLHDCRTGTPAKLPRPWEGRLSGGPGRAARVAVTGATGFIGAHVLDRLVADGVPCVAVVRDLARLARISHLDARRLTHVRTDIRDVSALTRVFEGCDVVVHTVYGSGGEAAEQWSVTVEGTAAVLDAAAAAGVRRLVYVGTVAVYDTTGVLVLDEDTPMLPTRPGDLEYAQQKLAAERLVAAAAGGKPEVVSIQPTVVYGPWSPAWTVGPLRRLLEGTADLPAGNAGGICNAVHVHDVAAAIATLAWAPRADGQRLLISGPEPVRWGTFYDAYRAMLDLTQPVAPHHGRNLPEWESNLYSAEVTVRNDRLASFGFRPCIGFADGMAQVSEWVRWEGSLR
ncbi:NAD-dependent epimerase/dehydratase family protein [Nonomuraea angiospora]|uniref:NAD-dependent epimerase/dehydratase family protein n=1 Tax=Nonomuraea angiospora TaxID=46172 RepID=UPI0029B93D4D|nr:NAD-dependent epimerase/dehydratase family protein [Nonomuraea angiospora]MDX3103367.1 NAD-dependent epimerase/dehydratase family protein [Nonomuraea angiospora]